MAWSTILMLHGIPAQSVSFTHTQKILLPLAGRATRDRWSSETCFLQWTAAFRLLDELCIPRKRMEVELHCFDHRLGHIKIAQATLLHPPQHPSPTCSTTERCCHFFSSECLPFNFEGSLSTKRLMVQQYSVDHRLCHIWIAWNRA